MKTHVMGACLQLNEGGAEGFSGSCNMNTLYLNWQRSQELPVL